MCMKVCIESEPAHTLTEPIKNCILGARYDTDKPVLTRNAPASMHLCSPNFLTSEPDITPENEGQKLSDFSLVFLFSIIFCLLLKRNLESLMSGPWARSSKLPL